MTRISSPLPEGCRPPPGWEPPPPEPSPHVKFFQSTLSSMAVTGRHFGVRAFHFLSKVFSTLITALQKKEENTPSQKGKTYKLNKPGMFLKAFTKRPEKVIDKVLELLLQNPDRAKTILMNLARHWTRHPEAFVQYDKTPRMRNALRSKLCELFQQCILTREQLQLKRKIANGHFTEAEAQIMSGEPVTKMTSSLKQFQRNFAVLNEPKALGQTLWDNIYAFFDQRNELEDLMFVDGEERSFDQVVERMLFHRSFTSLRSDGVYASHQKLFLELVTHLHGNAVLDDYPIMKALVEKAHALLSDKTKAAKLKKIILEVLQIVSPLSKSPPRRT